jgi:endonuclease-3 related protein
VYAALQKHFGHQKWWPGETPFEVMVGAILTQNTAWTNVEKAILNLKRSKVLTPRAMYKIRQQALARLIRPAGYFNVKSLRLKNFTKYLVDQYGGNIGKMRKQNGTVLRKELLEVNGIGPETADSILLYALNKPFFVIDAYTKRIFSRHRILIRCKHHKNPAHSMRLLSATYEDWQKLFMAYLPQNRFLYNDFHAQIVAAAKIYCKSRVGLCLKCPLKAFL